MNRVNKKFLEACRIISTKYHKPLYEVLSAETSYRNVYRELESDGYTWDSSRQQWLMPMGSTTFEPAPAPAPAPEPPILEPGDIAFELRVTTVSEGQAIIVESLLDELFDVGEVNVRRRSRHVPRTNNAVQQYFELDI